MNNSLPQHPSVFLLGHQRQYELRPLRHQGLSLVRLIYISLLLPVLTAGLEPSRALRLEKTFQSMGVETPSRSRPAQNDNASHHHQAVTRRWVKRPPLSRGRMNQALEGVYAFTLAENWQLLQPPDEQLLRRVAQLRGQQLQRHLLSPFTQPRLAWDSGIVS